jgi:colicin import membrane protein
MNEAMNEAGVAAEKDQRGGAHVDLAVAAAAAGTQQSVQRAESAGGEGRRAAREAELRSLLDASEARGAELDAALRCARAECSSAEASAKAAAEEELPVAKAAAAAMNREAQRVGEEANHLAACVQGERDKAAEAEAAAGAARAEAAASKKEAAEARRRAAEAEAAAAASEVVEEVRQLAAEWAEEVAVALEKSAAASSAAPHRTVRPRGSSNSFNVFLKGTASAKDELKVQKTDRVRLN